LIISYPVCGICRTHRFDAFVIIKKKKEGSKPLDGKPRNVGPEIVVFDSRLDTWAQTNLSIFESLKKFESVIIFYESPMHSRAKLMNHQRIAKGYFISHPQCGSLLGF
jgi:hypothetical protein